MLWLIVGVGLAALGILTFLLFQVWGEEGKKARKKRLPPPEPEKDWKGISERLERRAHALEREIQIKQNEIRARDLKINDLTADIATARKYAEQEKTWREKEEAAVLKEKTQERMLRDELNLAQDLLDQELKHRIRLEQESKPLRTSRDESVAEARRLASVNLDLERRLGEATRDVKDLREQNAELKKKKEEEQWVAKSDYKNLESQLKRVRFEADQFKQKFPPEEWPAAMKPKPAPHAASGESSPTETQT